MDLPSPEVASSRDPMPEATVAAVGGERPRDWLAAVVEQIGQGATAEWCGGLIIGSVADDDSRVRPIWIGVGGPART